MHFLDLIVSFILWSIFITLLESKTCVKQVCWSCHIPGDPLTLSCSPGKLVAAIVKAGYRDKHSADNSCIYKPQSDCFDEAGNYQLLKQVADCVWKKEYCSFNKVAGRPRKGQCSLKMRAKYIIATHFECVNESDLHTLCVTKTPELYSTKYKTNYLISPGLPFPYAQYNHPDYEESLCRVIIRTQSGFGLKLWTIYMDVHIVDYIAISPYSKSLKKLVKEQFFSGNELFKVHIPSDSVSVEFKTLKNDVHAHTGFAIQYTSYSLNKTLVTTSGPDIHAGTTDPDLPPKKIDIPQTSINSHQIIIIVITFLVIFATVVFMVCFVIFSRIRLGNRNQQMQSNLEQEPNNDLLNSENIETTDLDTCFNSSDKGMSSKKEDVETTSLNGGEL